MLILSEEHHCKCHGCPRNAERMLLPTKLPTKLYNSNLQPLEVVPRHRDPQLQVAKNY